MALLAVGFVLNQWLNQQFASGDGEPSWLWKQYVESVCLSTGSLLLAASVALIVYEVASSRTSPRPSREYTPEELGESPVNDL